MKKILLTGIILSVLIAPSFASAITLDELQVQLAVLLQQIKLLQSQLPETQDEDDVIQPTCHTSNLWSWDYATQSCKGNVGEGDCDRDADCNTGYCAKDIGKKYGQVSTMDVCENKSSTTTQPSITVTAPNGGERWQLGNTHTILWTPYENTPTLINSSSQVTAYLEKVVNGKYVNIGKIVACGKASIHWEGSLDKCNSGNVAQPGNGYYIRLVNNQTGAQDRSDRPFTLIRKGYLGADLMINGSDNAITIPEGGATYNVSWKSNAESCRIASFNEILEPISGLPPAGTRSIRLNPNSSSYDQALSLYCTSKNEIEGSAYDQVAITANSANDFIQIISPNGGESINLNDKVFINWAGATKGGNMEKVSIALYKNDKSFKWIVTDMPTSGGNYFYYWYPSETIFSNEVANNVFKIYIIGYKTGGGSVTDISDSPFSIVPPTPQPSITVTSPNGGEKWQLGSTHSILWSPYNYNPNVNPSGDVVAYLDKLVYGNYISMGQVKDCGKASIHWQGNLDSCNGSTYPTAPGDYYIRVVNNQTGQWDRSDNPFTLLRKDYLSVDLKLGNIDGPVTIPAGGGAYNVSWTSNAEKCSLYNGTLGMGEVGQQINNLPPSGSRFIQLATPSNGNTNAYINLVCASTQSIEGGAFDEVRIDWTPTPQPSITVTSPNGGEKWEVGKTYEIRWNAKDYPSEAVMGAVLNDQATGYNIRTIIENYCGGNNSPCVNPGDGFYKWTIPTSIPVGTYKMRLICMTKNSERACTLDGITTTDPNVHDTSDAPFSIVASASQSLITVVSPNGGETLEVGKTYEIRWKSADIDLSTVITLGDITSGISYLNNSNFITSIDPGITSYNWTVPAKLNDLVLGGEGIYKIYLNFVTDTTMPIPGYYDISDAPFSIVAPTPQPSITVKTVTPYGMSACQSSSYCQGPIASIVDANASKRWWYPAAWKANALIEYANEITGNYEIGYKWVGDGYDPNCGGDIYVSQDKINWTKIVSNVGAKEMQTYKGNVPFKYLKTDFPSPDYVSSHYGKGRCGWVGIQEINVKKHQELGLNRARMQVASASSALGLGVGDTKMRLSTISSALKKLMEDIKGLLK
ncbi:GPI anchored serine-threonine rich family protein [Patescibacteria group bacterium]|nr:GPI anchored serine-threonine rich family protein [Patescibacteria group bacterium]